MEFPNPILDGPFNVMTGLGFTVTGVVAFELHVVIEFVKMNVAVPELISVFSFQAEDGIRDLVRSRGLGDVYKRQAPTPDHGTTSL